jgi:hypothetical protein
LGLCAQGCIVARFAIDKQLLPHGSQGSHNVSRN